MYSKWNLPVFLVPKKLGKYRFVCDSRMLNRVSQPDPYELPNISHLLDKLSETKYLSTLDLHQSYFQVGLHPESQPYTAFTYNGKRYQFLRMLQGHKTSSAQFSRLMSQLFSKVPFQNFLHFVDDLLVGANTVQTHIARLDYILNKLCEANLKLSPEKCKLFRDRVNYLGLTISSKGVEIDEDRVKAIKSLKVPSTIKETQKIIGIFSYNRKYIPSFQKIIQPIQNLIKKGSKFQWTKSCDLAFAQLKREITEAPVLIIPDPSLPFVVTFDASCKGFGGHLQQRKEENGPLRTVAYFSKAVPIHMRNWPATKLEFVAMHTILSKWRMYLQGSKLVTVNTDCKALLHFDRIFAKSNAAMQRKLASLAGFNLKINHISGESNVVSDF